MSASQAKLKEVREQKKALLEQQRELQAKQMPVRKSVKLLVKHKLKHVKMSANIRPPSVISAPRFTLPFLKVTQQKLINWPTN